MLVSLIIPSHNHTHLLPRLLDSALCQSIAREIEIIVVDDGSTIPCSTVLQPYREQGLTINLLEFAKSQGARNARIAGVQAATTQLIAMADADDLLWGVDVFERHVRQMLTTRADILHLRAVCLDEKLQPYGYCHGYDSLGFELKGRDIFAAYVNYGMTAAPTWLRICTKALWETVIPTFQGNSLNLYAEDVALSALLLFHAQSYLGSELVGYAYIDRPRLDLDARLASDLYLILEELVPYLQKNNCPKDLLDSFIAAMHEKIAVRVGRFCRSLEMEHGLLKPVTLPHPDKTDLEALNKAILIGNWVNARKLTQSVHLLLPYVRYMNDKPAAID